MPHITPFSANSQVSRALPSSSSKVKASSPMIRKTYAGFSAGSHPAYSGRIKASSVAATNSTRLIFSPSLIVPSCAYISLKYSLVPAKCFTGTGKWNRKNRFSSRTSTKSGRKRTTQSIYINSCPVSFSR